MPKLALLLRSANKIHRHLETYATPVMTMLAGGGAHILTSLTGICHPGFKTEGETERQAGPQWVHR